MIFPLAAVPVFMRLLGILWLLMGLALILIILIQKGKGGGLGAAFGGGAGSLLGTKTTDFFTKVTIGLVLLWIVLGVIMVKWWKPISSEDLSQPTMPGAAQPAPVTPPDTEADDAMQ
jgi:preprotein translocase subunit SecG